MTISIVPARRVPCWPWHLRDSRESDGHHIGEHCVECGTDVALPAQFPHADAVCLYCALNTGLLPLIETPPDDEHRLWEMAK